MTRADGRLTHPTAAQAVAIQAQFRAKLGRRKARLRKRQLELRARRRAKKEERAHRTLESREGGRVSSALGSRRDGGGGGTASVATSALGSDLMSSPGSMLLHDDDADKLVPGPHTTMSIASSHMGRTVVSATAKAAKAALALARARAELSGVTAADVDALEAAMGDPDVGTDAGAGLAVTAAAVCTLLDHSPRAPTVIRLLRSTRRRAHMVSMTAQDVDPKSRRVVRRLMKSQGAWAKHGAEETGSLAHLAAARALLLWSGVLVGDSAAKAAALAMKSEI